MSNSKQRRALRAAIGAKPQTLGRRQLAEDVCQVCAFISANIIGAREQDFRLQDGTLVELGINKRLEPPLGVRFPKSAAKRHPCLACGGKGTFQCPDCKGSGQALIIALRQQGMACQSCKGSGKIACEKCQSLGYTWTRDDFAPACLLCSQFIMAWLGEREKLAMFKQGKAEGSKIVLPSAQQAQTLARIIRP